MLGLPKKFILLDVECTTWEGAIDRCWSGPGEHREVVQIGAILVENLQEISVLQSFVRPRINPKLSDFFVELTGIEQKYLNNAPDFALVLRLLNTWCRDHQIYVFDARADGIHLFDRDVLIENCDLCGLEFPLKEERFRNIHDVFLIHDYRIRQSGAAPEVFGIVPPSRPHDALNDVRGILIALNALNERVSS